MQFIDYYGAVPLYVLSAQYYPALHASTCTVINPPV